MVFKVRSEGTSKELAKHRLGRSFLDKRENMKYLYWEFKLPVKEKEDSGGPCHSGFLSPVKDLSDQWEVDEGFKVRE